MSTIAGHNTATYADGIGTNAGFVNPVAVAVDSLGTLYVVDGAPGHTIRKIINGACLSCCYGQFLTLLSIGSVSLFAGSNGVSGSTDALFASPTAIAVDSSLNVFVADTKGYRKISSTGMIWFSVWGPSSVCEFL